MCAGTFLCSSVYDKGPETGIPENHIIRFAFDSAEDLIKNGEDPLLLDNARAERKVSSEKFLNYLQRQISDKEDYYLLLDEVQNLGAFESVLNGFLRKQKLDVYVTGSNSKFLSKDILTEFEGRGDEIHILPLSFSEFFSVYDGTKEDALDDLNRFDVKGKKYIGSKRYYIQSAYAIPDEEKYRQETKSFDKAKDSFKKIIIVEKSMKPRRDDNGYVMMGVKEFLLDAGSLER